MKYFLRLVLGGITQTQGKQNPLATERGRVFDIKNLVKGVGSKSSGRPLLSGWLVGRH
jgi:hypothetical protein